MRFLRTNTAIRLTVGPFFDKADGVTPETGITVTACKLTLMVDDANVPTLVLDVAPTASGGANDMVHVTGDDAGFYDLELAAANVNYLGRAMLAITDAAVHCPVFHEFMILPAMVYDSFVLGTDVLQADVTQYGGSNGTFSGGRPEVNTTHAAGTAWGSGAITAGSLAADAITAAKIADGAIDAATFAASAITAASIAADAITAAKIADGAIDAATFAAGAINAAAIAADAITDAKVASDVTIASVTGAVGSVTGAVGSVTGAVGSVTGAVGSVASGGITAASFAADAITAAKLHADVTTELQGGLATSAALTTVAGYLDTEIAAILALLDDARGEPGQGAPPVNPDLATKIDYLYKFLRNKLTQTATTLNVYADDGATIDHKSTVSDDGTTYTRGELVTGA